MRLRKRELPETSSKLVLFDTFKMLLTIDRLDYLINVFGLTAKEAQKLLKG